MPEKIARVQATIYVTTHLSIALGAIHKLHHHCIEVYEQIKAFLLLYEVQLLLSFFSLARFKHTQFPGVTHFLPLHCTARTSVRCARHRCAMAGFLSAELSVLSP